MTLKEIAERAGVSRGTVDRVMKNRGGVNPETEKRVRRIVEESGYTPNRAGVALVPAEWKLGMELVYLLVSPSLSLEA